MEQKDKKMQPLGRICSNCFFMLGKVLRLTPLYIVMMIVEGVIWGIINASYTYINYFLFNALDVGESFGHIAALIGLMALFHLGSGIFDKAYWIIINPWLKQQLHYRMHRELFVRAQSLDLACYDNPSFYTDFVFAMDESNQRAVALVEEVGKLINRFVSFGAITGLLFTIDPLITVFILLIALASTVIWLYGNRLGFQQQEESKPLWRKRSYINRVFHLSDYAKELRTSRAGELLIREFDESIDAQAEVNRRYGKKYFLLYSGSELLEVLLQFGTILIMLTKLLADQVLLGGFAASLEAIWSVRWSFFDLCQRIARFPEHSLYIEKYRTFLQTEPAMRGGSTPISDSFASLEMRHVSFAYPAGKDGEVKETLHDVNLTIRRGDKIALVGYNGAGKTTLIKLLMRLYDPTEGVILWNGVDIREYPLADYRHKIGTVFQDFKLFAASIAENVLCDACTPEDEQAVRSALDAADFTAKLETLPDGIQTHLTREFNKTGTNLSGGEAQKVAIARVFARPYNMIIMDEPSAALDPLAEYALNHSILEHCANQTVIFISHRLSTTRMAEQIYMLADGSVVESGSHDALMALGGKYAEMFTVQAKSYVETEAGSAPDAVPTPA